VKKLYLEIALKINEELYKKELINYETFLKKEKSILNEFN